MHSGLRAAAFMAVVLGVVSMNVARGQATSAEIAGTIVAPDSAPLSGVAVSVTNLGTGALRQTVTRIDGTYAFPSLPVGQYALQAELMNFQSQMHSPLELHVAERMRIDMTLALGEVRESITITEASPLLRTNPEVGEVISNQRVANLPLNGRRFPDLMLLTDNTVKPPSGTRGSALGQTGPGVAIAGQRAGHNLYFLDGVSVTDQYFNNLSVSPSIDSIQEFNIQKSIYAAEYGGKASATVSAATKAGTNQVHGSLYEFFRNSSLDARNFFNGPKVPPLRQNQFGGTVGGPIQNDKMFFFLSAEALRERRALTRTFSMPTEAVRGGDFSGLAPIYDPLSGDPQTGRRVAFAGNRIPVTRLDPVAVEFLNKVPLPNQPGNVQNYAAANRSTNDNDQFTTRVDRMLSENDTLFGRFTFANYETFRPFGSTQLNEELVPGFGTNITTRTRNLAVNQTHVFSPTLIHEMRFGFLRVSGGQELENAGDNFAQRAGLAGVTADPNKAGFPAFNFADAYSSMGDPSNVVSRNNDSYDVFTNLTWIKNSHTFKVGGYFYRLYFNPRESLNSRGTFNFTPRFTSSARALADGNAFGDFLLGYPSQAQAGIGRGEENARTNWVHLYIQDDWRATRTLQFNVGLRYEINGHLTEKDNRLSNIEVNRIVIASDDEGRIHPDAQALLPLIPVPVVTSKEAGYSRSLLRPSYRRFAPRFGLSWSPGSGKTVLRAGFGLFFNQWAYSVQTALMQNLPFYFNKSVTTAADTLTPTLSTAGILQAPGNGTIGGNGVNEDFRTEYAESWTLSLQQQLAANWVVEASYFGSRVVGADDTTWDNIPEPGAGAVDPRRPNPLLSGFKLLHWGGSSKYHAGSVKLERRFSRGAALNVNYTWSKATDVASSPGPTFSETNYPQNVRDRAADWGLSSFDHRHRVAMSFSYELPMGIGYRWSPGSSIVSKIVSGWSVMGTGAYQSGAPFNVNIPGDNANIGGGPSQRADLIRNPNLPADQQTPERWFDTGAFVLPQQYAFGNAGRNIVTGDGLTNTDLSLLKRTPINERVTTEFRAEFFNAFNNVNFSDAPGRIAFTQNFGRYFTADNPRQIQLALKILF